MGPVGAPRAFVELVTVGAGAEITIVGATGAGLYAGALAESAAMLSPVWAKLVCVLGGPMIVAAAVLAEAGVARAAVAAWVACTVACACSAAMVSFRQYMYAKRASPVNRKGNMSAGSLYTETQMLFLHQLYSLSTINIYSSCRSD